MCQFESGVVVFNSSTGDITIYTSETSSSHETIRKEHSIRDGIGITQYQCPVEVVPVRDFADPDGWDFRFDAHKPDWWRAEFEQRCRDQLIALGQRKLADAEYGGDLDLRSLTTLPENVTLSPGGDLYLGSLTTLPENVTLSPGGDLDLRSLTTLSENVTLSPGGYLDLGSLTTLPENVTLSPGGYLYVPGSIVLPDAVVEKDVRVIRT